jgi:hypothetical protein
LPKLTAKTLVGGDERNVGNSNVKGGLDAS